MTHDDPDLPVRSPSVRTAALSLAVGAVHAIAVLSLYYRFGFSVHDEGTYSLAWSVAGLLFLGAAVAYPFVTRRIVSPSVVLLVVSGFAVALSWDASSTLDGGSGAGATADWGLGTYVVLWPLSLFLVVTVGAVEARLRRS